MVWTLEELQSLATKRQVHPLIQPPHTLVFIEPELQQSPQFLPNKTSSSDKPARSGRSHVQWGFVLHPSSDSPKALCLSVNAEILFLWREREGSSHGIPFLTGHSGSANMLHVFFANRAWVCGKVWPCRLKSWISSSQKVIFLKNYWVFLQVIFHYVTANPREQFWGSLGQKCENSFFCLFSTG